MDQSLEMSYESSAPNADSKPIVHEGMDAIDVTPRDEISKEVDEYTLPTTDDLKKKLGVVDGKEQQDQVNDPKIEIMYMTTPPKEEDYEEKSDEDEEKTSTVLKVNVKDIDGVDSEEDWDKKRDELNKQGLLDTNYLFGGSRMYRAFVEWGIRNGIYVEVGKKVATKDGGEKVASRGYVLKEGVNEKQAFDDFKKSPEGKASIAQNLQDETQQDIEEAEKNGEHEEIEKLQQRMENLQRFEMAQLIEVIRNEQANGGETPRLIQEKITHLYVKMNQLIGKDTTEDKLELEVVKQQISDLESELSRAKQHEDAYQHTVNQILRDQSEMDEDITDEESAMDVISKASLNRKDNSKDIEEEKEELKRLLQERGIDLDKDSIEKASEELRHDTENEFRTVRNVVDRINTANMSDAEKKAELERMREELKKQIGKAALDVYDELVHDVIQFDMEVFLDFLLSGEYYSSTAKDLGFKTRQEVEAGKIVVDKNYIDTVTQNDSSTERKILCDGLVKCGLLTLDSPLLQNDPDEVLSSKELMVLVDDAISQGRHVLFSEGILQSMGLSKDRAELTQDGITHILMFLKKQRKIEKQPKMVEESKTSA